MYTALDLAKYIVSKCVGDNCPINNITLQKILFCIQKAFLSEKKQAFYDEFEAWGCGPVVPAVYYYYSGYGAGSIYDAETAAIFDTMSAADKNIIDSIIETIRRLPFWETAATINRKNGAWHIIFANGKGNHMPIPADLIKKKG